MDRTVEFYAVHAHLQIVVLLLQHLLQEVDEAVPRGFRTDQGPTETQPATSAINVTGFKHTKTGADFGQGGQQSSLCGVGNGLLRVEAHKEC